MRECVLVVEDEDDARDMMRELVELGGCVALLAANGAEALKVLDTTRPCLVVVDLMMPVMDGSTFIATVRGEVGLAGTPLLVATSAPDLAPAGVPVMTRPIDPVILWDWMRRSCRCAADAPASSP